MDIDDQISSLQGKTTSLKLGSKKIFVQIGVSLVLSIILLYISKPRYILNIFYDEDEQEIKIKINMSKMLKVSLIVSIIIFFALKKSPFFT
jgi:hypothetical protein